jgi:uncharacterized protein (TIGR02996 family)
MSEESAFVRAILADPGDRVTRLVYADWLDERSDPRGEYLRLLCAARGGPVRARLEELRPGIDPLWAALMEREHAADREVGAAENAGVCVRSYCRETNAGPSRFCEGCAHPLPLPRGTVLAGRYRIDRLLHAVTGRGGWNFGPIYQAADLANPLVPVVVREFTRSGPEDFRAGLPFFRAAHDTHRLLRASPLVPDVFEFIEERQSAYLVTEHLPGPSLDDLFGDTYAPGRQHLLDWIAELDRLRIVARPAPLIEESRRRLFEWALDLGKSLCDLLALMHAQEPPLLKRNLGLDDLLVNQEGKVKAVNLGLAWRTSAPEVLCWRPLRAWTC